jgi:hypothetical protein
MSLTTPSIKTVKNAYMLVELRKAAAKEYSTENFDFFFDKSNNQVLYTKWISKKSPTQVNLPANIQKELDGLAAAKEWSKMSSPLKAARDNIANLFNRDTVARFAGTPDGQLTIAAAQMGIDNASKATPVKALLTAYLKPRSPGDQWQAYVALQKLVSKSKLDPVLKALDVPPPAGPVDDKATIAKNLEIDKIVKKVKVDMAAGMKYFASAQKYIKEKGLPSDREEVTRMFESGRRRHDLVHLPYMEAFRQDKAFKVKYKAVVADKEKFDAAWAAVRTAIDRR